MTVIIESMGDQNILPTEENNHGIVKFDEIGIIADMWTSFEFNEDVMDFVTICLVDANGKRFRKVVNLGEHGLTYKYILDRIPHLIKK